MSRAGVGVGVGAGTGAEWCVVDLETTGLFPSRSNRVIEIALVAVSPDGEPVDEWHSLVNARRDLGETPIHGITAELVNQAPSFEDLLGDILRFIDGRRLVAHNAAFDRRFLEAEFERVGAALGMLETLCTMRLASRMGIARSLEDCCVATEIENTAPHVAIGDARATAELFAYLLKLRAHGNGWPPELHIPEPVVVQTPVAPSGLALTRAEAAARATPRSYLSRLVGRLPTPQSPAGASLDAVADYTELLDRVLEDRIVTDDELADLAAVAQESSLGRKQLEAINLAYMRGLVSIALADGLVTQAEHRDLERAAALLEIDSAELDSLLADESSADPCALPGDGREFEGMTVCFTGSSNCAINGERVTRGFAREVASDAGLTVLKGVSKRLDILVVADPDTQSGKARKAREHGTRIIAERSFWPRIGVAID